MGRKKVIPEKKRSYLTTVKLTLEESIKLENLVHASGLSISEFVRIKIFNGKKNIDLSRTEK